MLRGPAGHPRLRARDSHGCAALFREYPEPTGYRRRPVWFRAALCLQTRLPPFALSHVERRKRKEGEDTSLRSPYRFEIEITGRGKAIVAAVLPHCQAKCAGGCAASSRLAKRRDGRWRQPGGAGGQDRKRAQL